MRILFAGTPAMAVPSLRALHAEHEVVAVLTAPDRPAGRGRRLTPSPVRTAAEELGLPSITPQRLGRAAREEAAGFGAELLVCIAYGRIFGPRFLGIFPAGGINLHPSLLPRHRGPSPIPAAILAGDAETGLSVQDLALEMDAGDIILQEPRPLNGTENTEALTEWAAERGAALLAEAVSDIEGGRARRLPQAADGVTYCRTLRKEDGVLDWRQPAWMLDRAVRAFHPWPAAQTSLRGKRLRIFEARLLGIGSNDLEGTHSRPGSPGLVSDVDMELGILVETGDAKLALRSLQLEGKRRLFFKDFLNGVPDIHGSVLGT